jgi:hypothetical protein
MTATVTPLARREERAARAALARLSPEQRVGLMEVRHAILTLGMWAQDMHTQEGLIVRELADTLNVGVSSLLGFQGFTVRDIPPENGR